MIRKFVLVGITALTVALLTPARSAAWVAIHAGFGARGYGYGGYGYHVGGYPYRYGYGYARPYVTPAYVAPAVVAPVYRPNPYYGYPVGPYGNVYRPGVYRIPY